MPLLTQTNGGSLQNSTLATINTIAASIFPSQGNIYFVAPYSGSDRNPGTVAAPFKTLAFALSQATAGQNDVIYLLAQSNTAANTTDYQTATLNWNKDLVHLVGVNDSPFLGQRSRVAFDSAYATASNLFTLSANGCLISGISFFAGVASALPTGCMQVTGQRNRIVNCQISGMGNSANDISGAYSLYLNGAAENVFENCYIGLDTVTLGAQANSQIKCASAATRNLFSDCQIVTYTNHATNNNFLRCPTSSLDRWLEFSNCRFVNPIDSSSTNLTQAFIVASDAGGTVLLTGGNTGVLGATDWNSTDSGNVTAINGTVTAGTYGLAVDVTR